MRDQHRAAGVERLDPLGEIVDGLPVAGERGRAVVRVLPTGREAVEQRPGALGDAQVAEGPDLPRQPQVVLVVVPVAVGQAARA
ncbi:hypothetical protein [Saccharopolyspora pogona]|uniref:hypothetical protein n=1 Tax=Saccharopolyspora pogona TaxID=333966 RepID=UPI00168868C7|nr:hypothetical protein [Saccharopolyspora pogona]